MQPAKFPRINAGHRQGGSNAVEFAVVSLLFFTAFFALIEFGRFMYVYESVQEVTRRAAREAVVRWRDTYATEVVGLALLGGGSLPAAAEVNAAAIRFAYRNQSGAEVSRSALPADRIANIVECLNGSSSCIASVEVSVTGVSYRPMTGPLASLLALPVPQSTVTMPAESMGF